MAVSDIKDGFAVDILSKFKKPAAHEELVHILGLSLSPNPLLYPPNPDSQEMGILASLCRRMRTTTLLEFFYCQFLHV